MTQTTKVIQRSDNSPKAPCPIEPKGLFGTLKPGETSPVELKTLDPTDWKRYLHWRQEILDHSDCLIEPGQ